MLNDFKKTGHREPQSSTGIFFRIALRLCLFCFILVGTVYAAPPEDTRLHKEAKLAIYHKDWHTALRLLTDLEKRFPQSSLRAEVFYWQAFTLEKMSHGPGKPTILLAQKIEAIEALNQLIKEFPQSPWCDDGQMLRIAIATDLTMMDRKGYLKYIMDSVHSDKEEDIELKLVGLDALLLLDQQLALELLSKEYLNTHNASIQENILFILRRANQEPMIQRLLDTRNRRGLVTVSESDCTIYQSWRKLGPHIPIRRVLPTYPSEALQECLSGKVVLKIVIDRRGRIFEIETQGTPPPILKEATIKAVRQWIYNPFTRNDIRETVSCTLTFYFSIELHQ